MLIAAGPTPQDLATWVGIPSSILGLGLLTWALLSRRVRLSTDVIEQVAALEKSHKTEMTFKDDRITALVADRDSWREAWNAEKEHASAAERQASALLESTSIATQLVGLVASLATLQPKLKNPDA